MKVRSEAKVIAVELIKDSGSASGSGGSSAMGPDDMSKNSGGASISGGSTAMGEQGGPITGGQASGSTTVGPAPFRQARFRPCVLL